MKPWRAERLLAGAFFAGALPVLLGLLGLFSFLALTEELEDVGRGSFAATDAVTIVLMSLPSRLIELAPVSAMLGTLIGIGALAQHHELLALRAAGLSPWRLAAPLAVSALTFALGLLLVQALLVPGIERETARLRAKAQTDAGAGAIWVRSDDTFVRIAGGVSGRRLRDVEIHALGPRHRPQRLLLAESADILDDGRWSLASLRDIRLDVDPPVERALERSTWSGGFSREQTETLIVPVEALVLGELRRYIAVLEENGVDSHRHRVLLWQQFASPLGLLGMALLGMPLLLAPSRGTPIATRAALGAGAGILFFLAERLCGQGAILYRLPPAPAALAPGVIVLLLALWLISRAEGHHGLRHALERLREGRR